MEKTMIINGVTIKRQTEKAILVEATSNETTEMFENASGDYKMWFPKSQIVGDYHYGSSFGCDFIEVSTWIADQKGLI